MQAATAASPGLRSREPRFFHVRRINMSSLRSTLTVLAAIAALLGSVAFAQDADVDRSHPRAFVKDSLITTKVKTRLASEHMSSLARVHVDTDADGVVWL